MRGFSSGDEGDTGGGGGGGGDERDRQPETLKPEEPPCDEQVQQLQSELAQVKEALAQARAALVEQKQSQELEQQLIEAGAIDIETAKILAEARLRTGESTVEEVVSELAASKKFLFRSRKKAAAGSAVSGSPSVVKSPLEDLADQARQTGDRRALLKYLRQRRG